MAQRDVAPISVNQSFGWVRPSVFERCPEILNEVVNVGGVNRQLLEPIFKDIKENAKLTQIQTGPEAEFYNTRITSESDWANTPWFFLESYFYRRLFDATGYFENGSDPFAKSKQKSLTESLPSLRTLAVVVQDLLTLDTLTEEAFTLILHDMLWGNKADLALNPKGVSKEVLGKKTHSSDILINHTEKFFGLVQTCVDGKFDIIVDNVGLDVLSDLMVATVLTKFYNINFTFHIKKNPIFVSDVTRQDWDHMMNVFESDEGLKYFHSLWSDHLSKGKWVVKDNPYWNRFEAFWDLPEDLSQQFSKSNLVIVKGDANSRRVHGDLRWPFSTPTEDIAAYFPTNLAMIRTLKSETCSGLTKEQEQQLMKDYAGKGIEGLEWLCKGIYGVIQLVLKTKA